MAQSLSRRPNRQILLAKGFLSAIIMKLYRIGGDEFIALWKNTTNAKMETFIEKFRTVMGKKDFSVSIGSDFYSNGNGTLEEAIKRADEEMYRDKQQRYGRQ